MVTVLSYLGDLLFKNQYEIQTPHRPESLIYLKNAHVELPISIPQFMLCKSSRDIHTNVSKIEESEGKVLLYKHVIRSPNQNLTITSNQHSYVYHYILKSQGEGRRYKRKFVPYYNQAIPEEESTTPEPWSLQITRPEPFIQGTKTFVIPDTKRKRTCHECNGYGMEICNECADSEETDSKWSKKTKNENSISLKDKKENCSKCYGYREIICRHCRGCKELLHFMELIIEWTSMEDHHLVEDVDLPEHLLMNVSGDIVFTEGGSSVEPLTEFWDAEVNSISSFLINKHKGEITEPQRIIYQNHCVMSIPVLEIFYKRHTKTRRFVVYGLERHVYDSRLRRYKCCSIL